MENSVMGGGLLPVPGSAAGMLDLDPPLHRHNQHQHQFASPSAAAHHPQMQQMGIAGDHRPLSLLDPSDSASARCGPQKAKGGPPSSAPNYHRHHHLHSPSDEDEDPSFTNDENGAEEHLDGGNKSKKGSPWQRMKWTDEMVRLLIPVVACVEDESVPEGVDGLGKRKHGAAAAGVLQKKGKWKTVSKLMLDKGCYVSPQQCEDKFNDLNKRYKRLNEILGRGTTCQVVENPALLDSMHHVSAKSKEDVRKILSSKHLFYREMCAYHNGQRIPYSHELSLQSCGVPPVGSSRDAEEEEEDDGEDEDEEEDGDVEERNDEFGGRGCDSFQVEMDGVLLDTTKSLWEQRDWFRKRTLQLQEERTAIQMKAFELEKRRFKWQRFCGKKDRELERMRLENERMRLENERMALQVRQREAELEFNRAGELMDSAGYAISREL
ncbi:hypothetical protein Taro_055090 [Colocasia esculenta]|uniref:Myb/SANT-like DNA-binding domain-containing protein n=1 Tax=Colocasia esculenta TaxID=4460 RepID=A0A843XSE9_COLES|nr:hypothetical protein [Colocasia esculenta]